MYFPWNWSYSTPTPLCRKWRSCPAEWSERCSKRPGCPSLSSATWRNLSLVSARYRKWVTLMLRRRRAWVSGCRHFGRQVWFKIRKNGRSCPDIPWSAQPAWRRWKSRPWALSSRRRKSQRTRLRRRALTGRSSFGAPADCQRWPGGKTKLREGSLRLWFVRIACCCRCLLTRLDWGVVDYKHL